MICDQDDVYLGERRRRPELREARRDRIAMRRSSTRVVRRVEWTEGGRGSWRQRTRV